MIKRKIALILYSKVNNEVSAKLIESFINSKYEDMEAIAIPDTDYFDVNLSKIRYGIYKLGLESMPFANKMYHSIERWFVQKKFEKAQQKKVKDESNGLNNQELSKEEIEANKKSKTWARMANIFNRFQPEVVICMTTASHRIAIRTKQRLEMNDVKIYALISDYRLDKRFVDEDSDGYFVQNEDLKQEIVLNKIPADLIEVVGTPIPEGLLTIHPRNDVLNEYGLPVTDKQIIFITSGVIANDVLKDVVANLMKIDLDCVFLVNTRNSRSLISFIKTLTDKYGENRIYSIGHVDDLSKLYSIIDIAITTPTAFTTFELCMRHKPIILLPGISFSEQANRTYLTGKKLAVYGGNTEEIRAAIENYMFNADFAYEYISNQLDYRKLDTLQIISDRVYQEASKIEKKKYPNTEVKKEENNKKEELKTNPNILEIKPIPKGTLIRKKQK